MTTAVVIGASGGIGGALLRHFGRDPAFSRVIAISRQPVDHPDWLPADILREDSLARLAEALAQVEPLTRIVVATGRLHQPGLTPEKSMKALAMDPLLTAFAINAAGPALVAKHLLPLTPRKQPSLFAVLSARVGSIGDNRLGGWHAYRASKAALNMLVRTIAIEHQRTHPLGICVALHPGTVDTPLSRPFQGGVAPERLLIPDRAAEALVAVMDGLSPKDTGGFFAWNGAPIPW